MARKPRKLYDGALFHITQRGNNKLTLFKDNEDFSVLYKLIETYKRKYAINIYHYCFMRNHIHMLIELLKKEHMSKFFQGIFQGYQLHFRKKYEYCGRLYQSRYKSFNVEKDSYLLECGRYIDRNPLRAKIVKSLDDHKWSSYHYYVNGEKDSLITPNPMYLNLSGTPYRRQKVYLEYLLQERAYEILLDEKTENLVLL